MTISRRLRAFKRWMRAQGVECSDALLLANTPEQRISVTALCDLQDGDVVATIPKQTCLTIQNSCGRDMIEAAGLHGFLGLAVSIMYEQSLGHKSPWDAYLGILPEQECLPLVWGLDEVDALLLGTELYQIVKEDYVLLYEEWKECVVPLVASAKLNPKFFGVEQYFAAKSLIDSRSFTIDDYHGYGMVPLADLFNHKTQDENVHFTAISSHDNFDDVDDTLSFTESPNLNKKELLADIAEENYSSGRTSLVMDDHESLEMVIVKNVNAGAEVYNTYGALGNAALLHRYGFTEPNNPFDIVNIDLKFVLQWSSLVFSARHTRARLSLWRRLNFSNPEYFEISFDGEPEIEFLILLYIICISDDMYKKLDLVLCACSNGFDSIVLLKRLIPELGEETEEISKKVLGTEMVRDALLYVVDARDGLYGRSSMEDDIESLRNCCRLRERARFHSLRLRVSERRILEKLRKYTFADSKI